MAPFMYKCSVNKFNTFPLGINAHKRDGAAMYKTLIQKPNIITFAHFSKLNKGFVQNLIIRTTVQQNKPIFKINNGYETLNRTAHTIH